MTRHLPRPGPGAHDDEPVAESATFRLRHLVALVAALVGLLAALLAGGWGLGVDRGDQPAEANAATAGWVDVPGGFLRVTAVRNRSLAHAAMPGMQAMAGADRIPDGYTRYSVDLELAAPEQDLRWQPADLTVTVPGGAPEVPRVIDLGDGFLPRGTSVRGAVTVDVPDETSRLALRFAGGPPVPLALDPQPPAPPDPGDVPTQQVQEDHHDAPSGGNGGNGDTGGRAGGPTGHNDGHDH